MKIAYVRWKDAGHGDEQVSDEDTGLVELSEVGFLVEDRTDEERVTLVMEQQSDGPGRKWLTIPRVNICEMKTTTVERAFRGLKRA